MPLINCSECGRQISDKAELCPQCGYRLMNSSNNVITTQKTSKKLKALQALGIIPLLAAIKFSNPDQISTALWLFGIGIAWFFVIRIIIWWNHE